MLFQKILKNNNQITYNKNCTFIIIIISYILYYNKNQCLNFLFIIIGYFIYIKNIIKYIIANLYFISFLIIYKELKGE